MKAEHVNNMLFSKIHVTVYNKIQSYVHGKLQ